MTNLLNQLSVTAIKGEICNNSASSVDFVAKRAPIGEKFFPEVETYAFEFSGDISFEEYLVMEYSCYGIQRAQNIKPPIFVAVSDEKTVPLFIFDDIKMDRMCHSIIVKSPKGFFKKIKAEFQIDKLPESGFTVHKLYTCKTDELPLWCEKGIGDKKENFTPVDVSGLFNKKYDFSEFESVIDSGVFGCDKTQYRFGIPFEFGGKDNNLIAPPPPPSENEDDVINYGAKTKRKFCNPISRDSETVIEINKNAKEIFFVFSLSKKHHSRVAYASGQEILGCEYIEIYQPFFIEDVESFMIEVEYDDGRKDTNLPLNLSTKRHGIEGDIGVYGIPCDGSKVKNVIIHNRMADTDVCTMAVTLNETGDRLFPEMLIPEKELCNEAYNSFGRKTELSDNNLEVSNGGVYAKFDIKDGLKLTHMSNAFAPDMKISSDFVLKLRTADGQILTDFETVDAKCNENKCEITYKRDGVIFNVEIGTETDDGISFNLTVINNTEETVQNGIIFPCISGVDFGSFSDNWYFVPKYQNICSNETFYMYEESAPSFPMQFMDLYSPENSGGLCILTKERELVTRKYFLNKHDSGMDMYVEYPVIYGDIAPGEKFSASPAQIRTHAGDWRTAFGFYKTWIDSWYVPYKCQDKKWYRNCFWLLSELTDFYETMEITKFPCWFDEEKKEFKFRSILEEHKKNTGIYPDILHMWSWTNQFVGDDNHYSQKWGNFGEEDYDRYGGKEAFRNALHDIKDNLGVEMSIYMHPTLVTNTYPIADKYLPECKVKTESGGEICIEGNSIRMCHAEDRWRDYALSMYPRVYKDLGIPLLYIDEFSLRIENRCYEDKHGHHVPSNLLKTDRDFITRLKDIMPEEVVLYGEYAPADVNARYIDCNISYYIIDSVTGLIETVVRAGDGDDRLGRVYTDVYRFAFPKLVQLILPMAMRNISWHPQKFIFFNGEAVYDSFWDNEETRGTQFNVKAYKLKKEYSDCFTSDTPETMIETESPAICMNKFPGDGRCAYTVYNRAYSTYRGNVLKVKHTDGATYYDAWNDKSLDVEISDGIATIKLDIGAQEMGLIVVNYK